MPEDVIPKTPTRSLRASAKSANPQARMQELLQRNGAHLEHGGAEESTEAPITSSNEGNFIVSKLPIQEEVNISTKEVSEEDTEKPPKEATKQTAKRAGELSPKPSMKQSLKETVLDEGRAPEERISKTRLNVDIDEDLHFWLKGHAIQNRRKLNDLIPRILKAYRDEVEDE